MHLWVDDGTVGRAMVCCQYKLNHRCIWHRLAAMCDASFLTGGCELHFREGWSYEVEDGVLE